MRYTVEEIKVKRQKGRYTLVHVAATLRIQTGGEILTKWELLEYLLLVCLAQFKARPSLGPTQNSDGSIGRG